MTPSYRADKAIARISFWVYNLIMKRCLKILFFFLISALIALGVSVALIVHYVDPNQLKTPIQEQVLAQTGHRLNLQGPIRWKWYPMLSLELQKLSLDNQAPFKGTLLSADILKVDLSLWSLLRGKMILDLDMKATTLVLERTASGQGNWTGIQKALESPAVPTTVSSTAVPNTAVIPAQAGIHSFMPTVLLNSLRIQDAQLIYHDPQRNQHYMLSRLNLSVGGLVQGLLQGSNPLSLSFQVDQLNKGPIGHVSLKGDGSLKMSPQTFGFKDLQLSFSPPNGTSIDLHGQINIEDFSHPLIQGQFESNPFKLSSLFKDMDFAHHAILKPALQIHASFQYQDNLLTLKPFVLKNTEGLSLQGSLNADFAKALKMDFQMTGAQQTLTIKLRVDGAQPEWSLTQSGDAFDAKALLSLFDPNTKIEGKARISMQLHAKGSTLESLERSLSGKLSLQMQQGKINGIDLASLMKQALSKIHDLVGKLSGNFAALDPTTTDNLASPSNTWGIESSNKAFTPFDNLNATLIFANGIGTNSDLSITDANYRITGNGTIDLVRHQIDYKAAALLRNNPYPKEDEIGAYLFQSALPIKIQGTFQDPKIKPDLATIFKSAINYLQKNKVEQLIHQTIDKTLGKFLNLNNSP